MNLTKSFLGLAACVLAVLPLQTVAQTISAAPTPGGSNTQAQYNNAGALGGMGTLTYNTSTGRITSTYPLWIGNGVLTGCQDPTGPNGDGMIVCANTVNNVMELQQLNGATFSAIGFEDSNATEQGGIGIGNASAPAVFAHDLFIELNNATPTNWSIIAGGDACGRDLDVKGDTGELRLFACSGSTGTAYGTQTFSVARASGNMWDPGTFALGGTAAATGSNIFQITPPNDKTAIAVYGSSITGTVPFLNFFTTFNGATNTEAFNLVVTDTSHGSGAALMRVTGGASASTQELLLDMGGNLTINGTLSPGAINSGGGGVTTASSTTFGWSGTTYMSAPANGSWFMRNSANTSHIQFDATGIPVPSGTGAPTIATGSTDTAGEVTAGSSATSVVISFATPKTNAPFCTVTSQTQMAAFAYTISTTAITITQTATSANKIDYICVQH